LKAVFWGNIVGLTLCLLQAEFKVVPLDPVNYYMAYVPIAWNWLGIAYINAIVLVTSVLALLLPGLAIGSVKVVKALRFS
jgi:lipoprotein-releasing system permease protein